MTATLAVPKMLMLKVNVIVRLANRISFTLLLRMYLQVLASSTPQESCQDLAAIMSTPL
jgi:hypothetical protein